MRTWAFHSCFTVSSEWFDTFTEHTNSHQHKYSPQHSLSSSVFPTQTLASTLTETTKVQCCLVEGIYSDSHTFYYICINMPTFTKHLVHGNVLALRILTPFLFFLFDVFLIHLVCSDTGTVKCFISCITLNWLESTYSELEFASLFFFFSIYFYWNFL